MRDDLPTGTVTFLFTDVEGSTKLLHELGAEGYADALAEHRRVIREACASRGRRRGGHAGRRLLLRLPDRAGSARGGVGASPRRSPPARSRCASACTPGTPLLTDEGYVGGDVHRAARIAASGHGGQVLVSSSTARSSSSSFATSASTASKTSLPPSACTSSERATFRRSRRSTARTCPSRRRPSSAARQELAEVVELLTGEDDAPAHPHRPRRHRQDAACPAGRCGGLRVLPRRRLLGAARAAARSRALVARATRGRGRAGSARRTLAEHICRTSRCSACSTTSSICCPRRRRAIAALRACPNLDLLVTSRERLRIGGEQT